VLVEREAPLMTIRTDAVIGFAETFYKTSVPAFQVLSRASVIETREHFSRVEQGIFKMSSTITKRLDDGLAALESKPLLSNFVGCIHRAQNTTNLCEGSIPQSAKLADDQILWLAKLFSPWARRVNKFSLVAPVPFLLIA